MTETPDNGVHVPRDSAPPATPADALLAAVEAHNADPAPKGVPRLDDALATIGRVFETVDKLPPAVGAAWLRISMATQERIAAEKAWAGDPLDMILHCPQCGRRHIDSGEWAAKVHHTHSCQHCGTVWRPAIGPTRGVACLPGFRNANVCPGPVQALSEEAIAALDPGIRETVVWLRGHGFNTVKSGGGRDVPDAEVESLGDTPHVFISLEFDRVLSEADRLWFLLGGHPPEVIHVSATYTPVDRASYILVTGPGLVDREMLASAHARYMKVFPSTAPEIVFMQPERRRKEAWGDRAEPWKGNDDSAPPASDPPGGEGGVS